MITRNFNLYLNAGHSVPLVINVNQYDQGEQWVFTLYNADGTKYTPSTGAIVGIKSDGLGIINSGSVVDGNVVINETQQMTAAVGKAVFELMIDSQTHGTANFVVLVEEKPGNNADLSESDLSLLQEAIDATSPLPTGGSVGQVLTKTANGSAWSNAGTPTQEQVADAVSDWADEHITVSTGVVIDTSLAVAGAAADSKKVGDELSDLKSDIAQGGSFNAEVKQALMNAFNHVVWDDDDPSGQTYITALQNALYPPANLSSISAVYTQSGTVYETDSLDDLKADLVVTAHYSDSTTAVLADSAYVLSGTLVEGTSTITVTYGGKTTTFNVTVSGLLPTGYRQVSYIEKPTTNPFHYLNTEVVPTGQGDLELELGFMATTAQTTNGYFIVLTSNAGESSIAAGIGITNSGVDIAAFDGTAASITPNGGSTLENIKYDAYAKFTTSAVTITSGELTATTSGSRRSYSVAPLTLFALKYKSSASYGFDAVGRIYYANAKENGVDIMRLVPCVRTSDDTAGLYDLINERFVTATGLIAGE